jgi:hypothetical protein
MLTDISKKHISSIFRVEKEARQEANKKYVAGRVTWLAYSSVLKMGADLMKQVITNSR